MIARFSVGLLFVLSILLAYGEEETMSTQLEFSCFVFDRGTAPALRGKIDRKAFESLFLADFPVASERIETPKGAKVIGVLVVANENGKPDTAIALHHWHDSGNVFYSCQSEKIGKAPRLQILESSEQRLLTQIKSALNSNGDSE